MSDDREAELLRTSAREALARAAVALYTAELQLEDLASQAPWAVYQTMQRDVGGMRGLIAKMARKLREIR